MAEAIARHVIENPKETIGVVVFNAKQVAALYEANGILVPTLSNKVCHNQDEIEDYFFNFTAKGPVGKINESNIRHFGQMAINSGGYTFEFEDGSSAQARFSFVYRWNGERWMIAEQHSSQMPEVV